MKQERLVSPDTLEVEGCLQMSFNIHIKLHLCMYNHTITRASQQYQYCSCTTVPWITSYHKFHFFYINTYFITHCEEMKVSVCVAFSSRMLQFNWELHLTTLRIDVIKANEWSCGSLKSKIVNFFRFCDFFFLQTGSIQKGQNGVKKKNSKRLILVFFM